MAPNSSPSSSRAAVLLAVLAVVLVLLLGMGRPATAATACKDCAAQCNSTCSAANFAGAGPCGADCSPSPSCPSCLAAMQRKCFPYCERTCQAQAPVGYDCASDCNRMRLCGEQCSMVCRESATCTACKADYSRGCTSCCTSYCKCHCV